eukprot:CAMPEP_0178965630 /NCGR_PEP_ID=MMETSP0789-20121207/16425_1 /TAXON_ID=3005 /ORGANISM="Rhizosolenia setigera, Strain CCMP 1694" /LENGTH=257 /DNA_ID=CAMNT_0020650709 /DNA_START=67 /DNA_END=840 /DNA_ORIENTATION=+
MNKVDCDKFDQEEQTFLRETFIRDDESASNEHQLDEHNSAPLALLETQDSLFPELQGYLASDAVFKCFNVMNESSGPDVYHFPRTDEDFDKVELVPSNIFSEQHLLEDALDGMQQDCRDKSPTSVLCFDKMAAKGNEKSKPLHEPPTPVKSQDTIVKNPMKRKRGRPKRDPRGPKRPLSAYNLFFRSERERLKTVVKEKNVVLDNLAQKVAERWRHTPDDQKKPFEEEAKREKIKYKKKLEEFQRSLNSSDSSVCGY